MKTKISHWWTDKERLAVIEAIRKNMAVSIALAMDKMNAVATRSNSDLERARPYFVHDTEFE